MPLKRIGYGNLCAYPSLIFLAAAIHITYNARFAYSSYLTQKDTAPALRHASQLDPADAATYARLAALDPDRRTQWIDAAIARNPTNSLYWIERSVGAELSGHASDAETSLLESVRHDHLYSTFLAGPSPPSTSASMTR